MMSAPPSEGNSQKGGTICRYCLTMVFDGRIIHDMSAKKNKKTGKWDAQFRVRKPDGTLALTTKRGFDTKDAALRYELTHKHDSALTGSDTFFAMFESMTANCNASETTSAQRRTRINAYCKAIKDRSIQSLSKADFASWRESLLSYDLSTQTRNDIINLIKQVGRHAWEHYDIPDNTKLLKPFKKDLSEYKEMTILTFNQFQALLAAEDNELIKTFFQTLYMTGMRKGEAKALLKSDYNPVTKSLYVGKAMRLDEESLKTTKTGNVRWIPLDDNTAEKLSALALKPGKYLFGDFLPIPNETLRNHFKNDLRKAGLPDCRIHDLRHSHVSLLWANGVPIPEIAKRLGHSSPRITMEKYSHIFDTGQSATLNLLNSLTTK